MNTTVPLTCSDRTFPLSELDTLDGTLRDLRGLLDHLEGASLRTDGLQPPLRTAARVRECVDELEARRQVLEGELDRITRPSPVRPSIPSWSWPGVTIAGETVSTRALIRIYLMILRYLQSTLPTRWEEVAARLAARGRCRRYLARSPEALFPGRSTQWTDAHCVALRGGWFADTNLSAVQIRTLAREAVDAAGLRWGVDVVPHWH